MAVHKLVRKQLIHADIEEVWAFFSSPDNLAKITPEYMKFRTTSEKWAGEIYAGQIITYKVSPLLGIPLYWMTEITQVNRGRHFIDEQRKGPYKMWHHQHFFEPQGANTLMTDIVHYELPLYLIGELAHALFVKRQLNNIFDYRYKTVERTFKPVA
jgi:ligand-binding SRPBCC domain-containing protein